MGFCVNCGKKLDSSWKVCPDCGTKAAGAVKKDVCPGCGEKIKQEWKYCPKCNASISGDAPPTPEPKVASELLSPKTGGVSPLEKTADKGPSYLKQVSWLSVIAICIALFSFLVLIFSSIGSLILAFIGLFFGLIAKHKNKNSKQSAKLGFLAKIAVLLSVGVILLSFLGILLDWIWGEECPDGSIPYEDGCCLDRDGNSVCDTHEGKGSSSSAGEGGSSCEDRYTACMGNCMRNDPTGMNLYGCQISCDDDKKGCR